MPKAHQVTNRTNLYEAKGIDTRTGKRKSYYGKSPGEASRLAHESFGLVSDNSLYSFYARTYLPTVAHRSANWLGQIAWAMDGYIIPQYGHRDLTDIRRPELQLFFNSLSKKLKASSVGKVKGVMGGVFKLAEADELITKSPVSNVRIPKGQIREKRSGKSSPSYSK